MTSPPPSSRKSRDPTDVDIYTRLSADAEVLRAKKAALCESAEKEQLKDCSFSPQIPTYPYINHASPDDPTISSISGATSVFDRLSVPQAHPQRSNEETFQPKLNEKAKSVPLRRTPEEAALPVYDRLLLYGNKQKELRLANEKKRREEEQQECSFSPHISATPDGGIWREPPDAAKPLSRSSSPTRSASPNLRQPADSDVFHRLHMLKTDSFSAKLVVNDSNSGAPLRNSTSPKRSSSPPPKSPQVALKSPTKSKVTNNAPAFDPAKVIKVSE